MKKYLLIVTLFIFFLVGVKTTSATNGSSEWDDVWTAIGSLQAQINTLQAAQNTQVPAGSEFDPTRLYQNQTVTGVEVPAGETASAEANCNDSNDTLLSGGFSTDPNVTITASYPRFFTSLPGWWVTGVARGEGGQIKAYVYCYRVD